MAVFGHYLTSEGLQNIATYKYSSGAYTALDNLLNRWWNYVAEKLPMWLAPNLITLLGFIASWISFAAVMTSCPNSIEAPPAITCIIVAISVFAYQTLDAVDGKQARRTGTSSPLGTLFDHGCDIITATILGLATTALCRTGVGLLPFLVVVLSAHLVQFLYMWWEYHFHVFYSNPGYATGVSEAQLGIIIFALLTAYFGSSFWLYDLSGYLPKDLRVWIASVSGWSDLPLNRILVLFIILNNAGSAVFMIVKGLQNLPSHKRFKGSLQVISFSGFICLEWFFYRHAILRLHANKLLCYLIITLAYATISIRILLSSTSMRVYHSFQWPAAPFAALSFGWEVAFWTNPTLLSWIDQNHEGLLLAIFAWQFAYLIDLLVHAIHDICTHLKVHCFTIPFPPPSAVPTLASDKTPVADVVEGSVPELHLSKAAVRSSKRMSASSHAAEESEDSHLD